MRLKISNDDFRDANDYVKSTFFLASHTQY